MIGSTTQAHVQALKSSPSLGEFHPEDLTTLKQLAGNIQTITDYANGSRNLNDVENFTKDLKQYRKDYEGYLDQMKAELNDSRISNEFGVIKNKLDALSTAIAGIPHNNPARVAQPSRLLQGI